MDDTAIDDTGRGSWAGDRVGLAVFVVLESLPPAERLAFMLHDLLGLPLGDTACTLRLSSDATERLVRRARRHLRGDA